MQALSPDASVAAPSAKIHKWQIAEREYARQFERRGRLHAYETLDARLTALVVVDVVPFFTSQNGYCRGIIPNVNRLAAALRRTGGTVAWVLPASGNGPPSKWSIEFYGPAVAELFNNSAPGGDLSSKLCPELDHRPDDVFVEKTSASAFFPGKCPLPDRLRERRIDTVLVTGMVTNVCCESSVRDAATLGFRVIMAADANATRTDAEHNATLHTVYRTFGDVRSTDDIVAMIERGV